MTKQDLIIIGAGGFGRELHVMLFDAFDPDAYQFKGFLADQGCPQAEALGPILGSPNDYQPTEHDRFLLAIGYMDAREKTTAMLRQRGGRFASYIHPTAFIASNATIGDGAVIYPYAVVSNAAKVADQVHLNYFASVGHDCTVGRCCLLAPYATMNGFSSLADHAYLSTHSTVVVGKHVGERTKVSANSTVQQDVPADCFVHGVPGRVTRKGGLG